MYVRLVLNWQWIEPFVFLTSCLYFVHNSSCWDRLEIKTNKQTNEGDEMRANKNTGCHSLIVSGPAPDPRSLPPCQIFLLGARPPWAWQLTFTSVLRRQTGNKWNVTAAAWRAADSSICDWFPARMFDCIRLQCPLFASIVQLRHVSS